VLGDVLALAAGERLSAAGAIDAWGAYARGEVPEDGRRRGLPLAHALRASAARRRAANAAAGRAPGAVAGGEANGGELDFIIDVQVSLTPRRKLLIGLFVTKVLFA
jgi:hypothetical protein